MLRLLDTFSGIGGFSYAAERIVGGYETVAFVEREPFCQKVLRKHWPDVPIFDDITTYTPERGSADVICGGFPCQDISTAGRQAGIKEGTRSGLFYELMRVIRMVEPRFIILENVSAILANGLDTVLGELAEAGFDAEWACIPASAVGACHQRDRWWLVAYAKGSLRENSRVDCPSHLRWAQDPNSKRAAFLEVQIAKLLPTPMARDYKGPQGKGHKERGYGENLSDALTPIGKGIYLNPFFIEEMMGYPVGWTELKP